MRRLLLCPCCMKTYDKRMLKKDGDEYTCPDIHCVGYSDMYLAEVDILLEPLIRRIQSKGWYTKFHKVTSRSGRLGREKHTVIEFFSEMGIPNDTVPEDFTWDGNILTSVYPENDELSNIKKLSDWVRDLGVNDNNDPMEFPSDYYNWYAAEWNISSEKGVKDSMQDMSDLVLATVADYYNLPLVDMKSRNRQEKMVKARQISAYFLKELCGFDMSQIAKVLEYKDSTAIAYAYSKCKESIKVDGIFAGEIDSIKANIKEKRDGIGSV